jgi:hypothetical protein
MGCCLMLFVFGSAWDTRLDGLLQIAIEPFVRIGFRRVTWQVKDFDLFTMLAQPLLDRLAVMHCEVAFGPIVEGAQATDTDVIVGGVVVDCTATEAAPDFVVSSVLVAVTVRFPAEAGAVKNPLELMVPPLVDHFTVEL